MNPRTTPDTLLDALRAGIGSAHVLTDAQDMAPYLQDWRRRQTGRARAVLRPADTQQVAALVGVCARHGTPIVPQGGNTGLVGGSVPDDSGHAVVLSLQRMARVRALDADNLSITVDAGCILQNVQAAAAAAGLLYPLSLAAEGSCTIGGTLATNAGGTQVLRYGNARELCLGLEVVTAAGDIWDGLSGLRKDNTGYDLRQLFIGSEGTLGVITGATLRLYPQPRGRCTALVQVDGSAGALALLRRARAAADAELTGFELMDPAALDLVRQRMPQQMPTGLAAGWWVLLELAGGDDDASLRARAEQLLGDALDHGVALDALLAESLAQRHAFWQMREHIPLAEAEDGLHLKHDISVPCSEVDRFLARAGAALARAAPGARPVCFGHLGDGNLHYNVHAPAGTDPAIFIARQEQAVAEAVYAEVLALRGSVSAEHGIGAGKRHWLPAQEGPVALGLMHALKAALDPGNLLNPGRVLP